MRHLPVASAHDSTSLHPVSVWSRLAGDGACIRGSRSVYHAGDFYPLHTHDYAECSWVTRGSITLTTPGGEHALAVGDICLIHPQFRHGFRVIGPDSCELVNIAVPFSAIQRLSMQYSNWVWGTKDHLACSHISRGRLFELDQWPERLRAGGMSELHRDACLLAIQTAWNDEPGLPVPAWLSEALTAFEYSPHIAEGVAGLVRLTGRSREHCSRVVRQCLSITLRELVNQQRLQVFCRLLLQQEHSITEAAETVWPAAPAHLYRLFKQVYGCTPRAWQRACAS